MDVTKKTYSIVALLLSVITLAGCGGGESSSGATPASAVEGSTGSTDVIATPGVLAEPVSPEGTSHYSFNYPSRSSLLAAGWDFLARSASGGIRNTEQSGTQAVSYGQTGVPTTAEADYITGGTSTGAAGFFSIGRHSYDAARIQVNGTYTITRLKLFIRQRDCEQSGAACNPNTARTAPYFKAAIFTHDGAGDKPGAMIGQWSTNTVNFNTDIGADFTEVYFHEMNANVTPGPYWIVIQNVDYTTLSSYPNRLDHYGQMRATTESGIYKRRLSYVSTPIWNAEKYYGQVNYVLYSGGSQASAGTVRIPADRGDLWGGHNDTRNSLFRDLPANWVSIRAKLSFAPTVNYQQAGLVAYQDDDNYVQVSRIFENGQFVTFKREQGGALGTVLTHPEAATDGLVLRLDRDPSTQRISAFYSRDGASWTALGSVVQSLANPRLAVVVGASPGGFPNADLAWAEVQVAGSPMIALSPSSIALAPSGGESQLTSTLSITNTGGAALNWSATVSGGGPEWLTVTPSSGTGNASLTLTASLAGLSPGSYSKTVTVAGAGAGNSPQSVVVTLATTPAGVGPDLVIGGLMAPASARAGQQIAVSVTVGNQGSTLARSFNNNLYLSADPSITATDRWMGGAWATSIAAGAEQAFTINLRLPTVPPGNYYLGALADSSNYLVESNETNNARAQPFAISN